MEKVLLAAFTAVESAHAFSAFCPSIFTIKTFATDPDKVAAVRMGYVPAAIFGVALGFIVSKLINSYTPLAFSVATSLFMVGVYEWSMR